MPAFPSRPLSFDDLMMPQDVEGLSAPGGVALTGGANGGYRLDPRYNAQLATNWAANAAPPTASPGNVTRPATGKDATWSAGSNGWYDRALAAASAAIQSHLDGDKFDDAYPTALDERRRWLAQRNSPPIQAGSIEAARAELAKGLAEGQRGDGDIYKTAAFRVGLQPFGRGAGLLRAGTQGLSLGWGDEGLAAAQALRDTARGANYLESYPHYRAAERERLDKFRQEHPYAALAAEEAGGLVTKGALSAVLGNPVAGGAVAGAIRGFGDAEGGISLRRRSMAR